MFKPKEKEIRFFRNLIKEGLNLKGFDIIFYSLNIDKTKAHSNFSNAYNEAPILDHYYTKYFIKGFITAQEAAQMHKKFGIEYIQTDINSLLTAVIYYINPTKKWSETMGNNTLIDNNIEESPYFLKVIPKIGDFLQYGKDNSQFFKITTVFPYGWDFVTIYKLSLMQLPFIKSENDLSSYIIEKPKENNNNIINDLSNKESWFQ